MNERTAHIVGCGIAGPVVAMFLRRAGIEPTIYEAREAPDDRAGAFLNVMPNGMQVLKTLGVHDRVVEGGHLSDRIQFYNGKGKYLAELEHGADGRFGVTPIVIRRGLLNAALREEASERGIPIEFGKRLVDVRDEGERGAVACFEDGTEVRGDVVIGCDGIHSPTRRSIFPRAPEPSYTGVVDSGAVTRTEGVPETGSAMRMIFGRRAFFGYTRTPTGDVYWFSNHHEGREPAREELERIPDREWRARLLDLHRDDPDPVVRIIESTEARIGRWAIYDLPSLPAWQRGPVCLIGDAAHATSPHVGGGASAAMEDAIVLAKCLRDIPETEAALARFHALRKDRVEKLVRIARRTGNQKAMSNPVLVWMRDLFMPFFLRRAAGSHDWIYSYRVEWETSAERAGAERVA